MTTNPDADDDPEEQLAGELERIARLLREGFREGLTPGGRWSIKIT